MSGNLQPYLAFKRDVVRPSKSTKHKKFIEARGMRRSNRSAPLRGLQIDFVALDDGHERQFFIDNLLVRVHLIIDMIIVDRS